MIFNLPTTPTLSNYDVDVTLDGVEYRLRLKFSERDQAWYLSFLDTNDNVLRGGLRVVTSWDMIRLWVSEDRPAPERKTTNNNIEAAAVLTVLTGTTVQVPTREGLGENVVLAYSGES